MDWLVRLHAIDTLVLKVHPMASTYGGQHGQHEEAGGKAHVFHAVSRAVEVDVFVHSLYFQFFSPGLVFFVQSVFGIEDRVRFARRRVPRRSGAAFLEVVSIAAVLLVRANPDIGELVNHVLINAVVWDDRKHHKPKRSMGQSVDFGLFSLER